MRERTVRWVRRNRALTASAAIVLTVVLLATAGSIGYVVSERANRLALTEQKVQAAVAAARAAIDAGDLALANRQAAEARGHVGGEAEQLSGPAAEIDRIQAEIDTRQAEIDTRQADAHRYQRFVQLTDDAQDQMAYGWNDNADRTAQEALGLYGVLDSDRWLTRLEGSTLTADQKRWVRETAYTTIVNVAAYSVKPRNRGRDAGVQGLDLLRRAEAFHEPTRAFYFTRLACYHFQNNAAAAANDQKRALAAPARTAWDFYVPGFLVWRKALETGSNEKFDQAIAQFRAALAMQPNHRNALFLLARCLERKKEYVEAAGVYTGCLALGVPQGRADVYAHRSICYYRMGREEAAKADIAAALDPANYDPNSAAEVRNGVGWALAEQGKLPEAEAVFRRSIELNPDDATAWYNFGLALTKQGKHHEAEAAYRQAIELKPDEAMPRYNLGNALANQGKYPEAEAVFRRAIELKPDDPHAHYYLGNALGNQGKYPEAEAVFRRAIELKPDDPHAHYYLGFALMKQKKLPEAEAAYRRAIELQPDYAGAHVNLGAALANQGKLPEAEAVFRRAIELEPDYADAKCGLADVLRGQGKHVSAIRVYVEAFATDPEFAERSRTVRYNAACSAALAGSGQGEDAETLDDAERSRFRRQAWTG